MVKGWYYFKSEFKRRDFLKAFGAGACLLSFSHLYGLTEILRAQTAEKGLIKKKFSPYSISLDNKGIQCYLCPNLCRIPEGERVFAGFAKISRADATACSMEILA